MLAAQAVRASERFTGNVYPDGTAKKIEDAVRAAESTVYLIGMPGCGKSTVGRALAKARLPLYRSWADATFRMRGIHTTVTSIKKGLGL